MPPDASAAPAAPAADPRLAGRAVRRVAFSERQIADRVAELGREITAAYPDGDLLVLGLLKGSFIF
jgi:hypoxanthine-guanine phosphoribosyltransferase